MRSDLLGAGRFESLPLRAHVCTAEQGGGRGRNSTVVRRGAGSVNHLSGGSSWREQTAEAQAGGSFPSLLSGGANTLEAINLLKTHFGPELFSPLIFKMA